ncbi:MAG: hypothetical protein JW787_11200 [Sedimentisphaerales bacterium]|nr:hypothetical protein [Sedimentisphaerales bacterium]
MCSFSNYWESSILNHFFGKSDYSLPEVYIGLLSNEPNEDGTGVSEPDCPSYTRAGSNASSWDTAFEGSIENISDITFPLACEDWGKVTHFALFDSESGGNILAYGSLSPMVTISSGDIPKFAPGDLIVCLD